MIEEDVRLTYRFLNHSKETEMRLIYPFEKEVKSIWVLTENEFVAVCKEFDGKANIYVGMNERSHNGSKAKDIISLNALVIDIDAFKEKDYPAKYSDIEKASESAMEYIKDATNKGRKPYLAFSGNGWQIWHKVFLDINDENRKKVQAVLRKYQKAVKENYEKERCKIDNIGDLARVIKVIGTKAVKPKCDEERYFRNSHWKFKPIGVCDDIKWSKKIFELGDHIKDENYQSVLDMRDIIIESQELNRHIEKMGFVTRDIFEGNWRNYDYQSRSEAEFFLLIRFAKDKIEPEYAWALMDICKIGKWQEENNAYRQLSITKAYNISTSESE